MLSGLLAVPPLLWLLLLFNQWSRLYVLLLI
jgi:hypothetical protein